MICKFPQILGLSVEKNIQPTMNFYETLVGESLPKQFILGSPSFLGYSLEKRLKPRLDGVRSTGLVIGKDVSFHFFARSTNDKWEEFLYQRHRRE